MKTIAMYLPQFHEVAENNIWWGEGYTEWVAVKDGKPLFPGHDQPKIPLNSNYYDLLDKDTLKEQVELAKKYDIYGFCFYHYWFEKGKQILEKPTENLLKWKDIDIPFCFCWANETWARRWSKFYGPINIWTSTYNKENEKKDNILLRQKYGREKDWKTHFDYLLQFFKDSRYIKKGNRPVVVIYRPDEMYCLSQMISFWNKEAIRAGFAGIYIIGENCTKRLRYVNGIMEHQPSTTCKKMRAEVEECFGVRTLNYDSVWSNIIKYTPQTGKDIFYMGFTGYDETPRHGENGMVIKGESPSLFEKYYRMLVQKSDQNGCDYIFLNAWNEWGEGMYIEPDEKNGYAFLESHKRAVCADCQDEMESFWTENRENGKEAEDKTRIYYKILNDWMELRGKKKYFADYLVQNGYRHVAIYGMGDFGKHLHQELKDSAVEVEYVIDRRNIETSVKVLTVEDKWPQVDAIIVTPFLEFEDILQIIEGKIDCPVLSIEEMIYENY